MQLYNRYIILTLLMPVLVITLTLTGIIWLTQSLRFIDLIVNRGLDVSTFLYLSTLLIPSLLIVIMPIALFSSVLYVYNRLISDSELIVFKSAGLNRMSLAKPALFVAAVVALVGYGISLYLLPASYREFKDTQAFIRNNYASVLLQEGVFNTPTKGLTVYIESRQNNGMLEGILVHDGRDPEKPVTMMAQEGKLVQTASGPRFDLINGNRQEIDSEEGNLSLLYFDSYPMDLSVYTDVGKRRQREPEERYLGELFFPDESNDDFKKRLLAEGHHRLSWPLYSFVLTLVALTSLFTGQFNRRGQWKRILMSTVFAVGLVGLDLGLKSAVASQPALAFLKYANVMVICGVCIYIMATSRIITGGHVLACFKKLSAGGRS